MADHCLLYVEGRGFDDDTRRLVSACQCGSRVEVVPVSDVAVDEAPMSLKVQCVSDRIDEQSRALKFYLLLPNQLLSALFAVSIFSIGCDSQLQSDQSKTGSHSNETHSADDGQDHSHDDHAAHDHSAKHGGHLIELGRNHEYHAELVDDHKTEKITVYMMDAHMEPLAIEAASISLVLTSGDKTETFELMASQSGGASEFASGDETMMEMVDGEEVKGKLRATIDGKPFSGAFEHHGHSHGEGIDAHVGHEH